MSVGSEGVRPGVGGSAGQGQKGGLVQRKEQDNCSFESENQPKKLNGFNMIVVFSPSLTRGHDLRLYFVFILVPIGIRSRVSGRVESLLFPLEICNCCLDL